MIKFLLTFFFGILVFLLKAQQAKNMQIERGLSIHADTSEQLKNHYPAAILPARFAGITANATCATATTLTVGSAFTCGSTSSNASGVSFPNACISISGSGIQDFRTNWYCFNSGTNKTLAIVVNNMVNTTSFTAGLAVFGPYASCAAGCS